MPPKLTAVAPLKLVPVMVTTVPPAVGPLLGLTPVTLGGVTKVNWSAGRVEPRGPAAGDGDGDVDGAAPCTGEVAVIWVARDHGEGGGRLPPKLTAVAPVKLVPVMVTTVPPAVGPLLGLTPVTLGGVTKVNWSAGRVEPRGPAAGVVTVTSTVPRRAPARWR